MSTKVCFPLCTCSVSKCIIYVVLTKEKLSFLPHLQLKVRILATEHMKLYAFVYKHTFVVCNPVDHRRSWDPHGHGSRPALQTGSSGNLEGVSQRNASAGGPEGTHPSAATVASRLLSTSNETLPAPLLKAWAAASGRRCMTHPEYPLKRVPASEIT